MEMTHFNFFLLKIIVYELWFNQIIHELSSIIEIFAQSVIEERQMLVVISRMKRMVEIYKVMVDQMAILETMDALDFMDFRFFFSFFSFFFFAFSFLLILLIFFLLFLHNTY